MKIQRRFLWVGVKWEYNIPWVKWEDVCKPKKLWGLSVRDLRLVNLALLGKWRWRLLSGLLAFGVIFSLLGMV